MSEPNDPFGINDPLRNPEKLTAEQIGVPMFRTLTEEERAKKVNHDVLLDSGDWAPNPYTDSDAWESWTLRRPTTPEERAAYATPEQLPIATESASGQSETPETDDLVSEIENREDMSAFRRACVLKDHARSLETRLRAAESISIARLKENTKLVIRLTDHIPAADQIGSLKGEIHTLRTRLDKALKLIGEMNRLLEQSPERFKGWRSRADAMLAPDAGKKEAHE